MFTPSQSDVRRFFCDAWRRHRAGGGVLTPLETIAVQWMEQHPEYHAELADLDAALAAVHDVESGRTNPFLHLSMHLSISEQIGIDQPRGIKQAYELRAAAARPTATPTSTACGGARRAASLHADPPRLEPVVGAVHDVDVGARRPRDELAVQRDVVHVGVVLGEHLLDQRAAPGRIGLA